MTSAHTAVDRQSPTSGPRSLLGFWVLLALIAGLTALYFIRRPTPEYDADGVGTRHAAVGQPLAEIALESLDQPGEVVDRASLAGKVTLLNFWGTWCPPCRAELPHVAAMAEQWRERDDFRLLAVSCWGDGNEELEPLRYETREYLAGRGLKLPTYADTSRATRRSVQSLGGFEGYPTTVLLDRQGIVRAVWTGYWPGLETRVRQVVESLLAEPAV